MSIDPYEVMTKIPDAYAFSTAFFVEPKLYRWQIEELLRLSGYEDPYDPTSMRAPTKEQPLLYTLAAANGSGKDQIVLARWALYSICCIRSFHWIGTSSSYTQLDEQTWRHIKAAAETVNSYIPGYLKIKKHKVTCPETKSEITLFRTDEGGKTEGWHPLVTGGPMAIVLNECKSLDEELVVSFKRCHGYTHWVNISSPGKPEGYFYEKCQKPHHIWPQRSQMGRWYFRRVNYLECPHLQAEYERDVEEFGGSDNPYIQSSYLAEFTAIGGLYIIEPGRHKYAYPAPNGLGLPLRAGLDLSLGGDSTVLSLWKGNTLEAEFEFLERHEPTLTRLLCHRIADLNIPPSQVWADAGGLGQPIIQRMAEAGCEVNAVLNQARPRNKKVFYNRGAELAWNLRRLVYDQKLNLAKMSPRLDRQMPMRKYEIADNGRIILEDKKEFRARAGFSPDHMDSAILANAGLSHHILKDITKNEEEQSHKTPDEFYKQWNEVYGELDNHRANAGAYRTTGVFRHRQIESPIQGVAQRLGLARKHLSRKP